jgi:hypothetical protein
MAENEPEYLKALRAQQARRKGGASQGGAAQAGGGQGGSVQEREALKWARETAERDPVVQPSVRGAKCLLLFKPASIDNRAPVMLDGVESREALAARLKLAEQNGQEVIGLYEVQSARPLTAERKGDEITFAAGRARPLPKAMSPEQMIRKAASQAEELAKTRKFDDRGFGGGGRGGRGGGRGEGAGRGGERGPRSGGDRGGAARGGGGAGGGTGGAESQGG